MVSLVKFGIPFALGVGSAGVVGSNWVFKKEEAVFIDIDHNEDWDKKVKELFTKVKDGNNSLKTEIAGSGNHANSLEIENSNNNNFKNPSQARDALKAWCQSKKNSNENTVTELCKDKQWVGWLFGK